MAIQFNKSEDAPKEAFESPTKTHVDAVFAAKPKNGVGPNSRFVNVSPNGLKVKMPDSVHIFLPGETIEFIEKDLGTDGAQKELDRRARRHALKSKASVEWKRNKGKK